jgi:hypothetical protein
VVDAAGRLFGQVGAIANGLYSLALNYIRTDSECSRINYFGSFGRVVSSLGLAVTV